MTDIESRPAAVQGRCPEARLEGRFVGQLEDVPPLPDTSRSASTGQPTTTDRPTYTAPDAEAIASEDVSARSPDRTIRINGEPINAEREITISAGGVGYAIADLVLYNLGTDTWREISSGDPVEVELGWHNAMSRRVFTGSVSLKRRRHRRTERAYVIRAEATGAATLNTPTSRTYNGMSPHFIVEDLVSASSGVEAGYISTESEPIDGHFALSGGRDLGDWLDRLVQRAADQTGQKWVWYVDNGRLYFHRTRDRVTDLVTFDAEKSLLRSTPVGSASDRQPHQIDLRCEPILRRGLTTTIENATSPSAQELFMVSKYLFESSTVTGRHHCSAQIDPMYQTTEDL